MRHIHKVVEILADRGRRGLPVERVYRHLWSEDLLIEAYARIGKNDGATTPGVDRETVDGMGLDKIARIARALRSGDWHWTPARRVEIPKPKGGTRPLGLPMCRSYCTSSQGSWGIPEGPEFGPSRYASDQVPDRRDQWRRAG
jgi:hypothetical protein